VVGPFEVTRMHRHLAFSILVAACAASIACGPSRAVGLDAGTGTLDVLVPGAGGQGGSNADGAPRRGNGDGAAGATIAKRSAGCGLPPEQALAKYVKYDIVVPNVAAAYATTHTNRVYWVRLPATYDPERAYPTVFLGPGCGASGQSPIPLQMVSGEDAILVGLNGINNCFSTKAVDSPEGPYFDETLKNVAQDFCLDTSSLYIAGFSSGSWLTSYIGCTRAGVIRAQASVAGGLPPVPACQGPIPAMYVSDTGDDKNTPATVKMAVERVRVANGCSDQTEPYDIGVPSPCVQYKGCQAGYPLVWCLTEGVGHADQSQTKISTVGFWHFWTSLPR
jgi:poly(3-hydroxybutyrate) depolymerase